jgi:hypothetical protein
MLNFSPSEHIAVDKVTVLFKGSIIFKKYIPNKHKHCGIRIYKLCNITGYTYDMSIYLGKNRKNATQTMTTTHTTVRSLTRSMEMVVHKDFFSSLDLFDDLHIKAINCHTES